MVAICEDEQVQASALKNCVLQYAKEKKKEIEVHIYTSDRPLWWDVEEGMCFDLFFLDIQLKDSNGMELAHTLRNHGVHSEICLVTGLKEYAAGGYDVEACGYLIKPYTFAQVSPILGKALQRSARKETLLRE